MADATPAPEAADTNELKPDVKIEDVGPAKKRLSITVSADAVASKIEDSLGALESEATLPGFRKGRAPRRLLEQRFGKAVRDEAKNQIVAQAYAAALEENKLRVIGDPEPVGDMEEIKLVDGEPISFSVDIEIVPEFDLPELEKVPVRKPVLDITDEHIDEEIGRQAVNHGTPHPIEDSFEAGDRLRGAIRLTKAGDEAPFFSNEQAMAIVPGDEEGGKGHVVGFIIDDLASILKKHKVGEQVVIETVGPESHEREDLRGEKITITFDIHEAFRIEEATPEQLAAMFGFDAVGVLRDQIRFVLEQRRDQEQRTAMREQIHEYLTEKVDFPLPEKASEKQIERTLERQRMELLYRGRTPEQVETAIAEARANSESAVRDRLKLNFILMRLADHFDVEVNEQEINGRIAQIAAQNQVRPAKLKADLTRTGRINEIAVQIRDHKAVDRIIEKADVTDVDAEAWNEEFKAREEAKKAKTKKKTTKKKSSKKTASATS